jgi:sterol 3beta-glucosyltransferase
MFTDAKASILEGLDHCITAPISINRNLLIDDHEVPFSRSMMEKNEVPRHDLKLDRLSEREKVENRIMHCKFPY